VRRYARLLAPVAIALFAGALLAAAGCSSSAPDEGWKAQKAYGAKMAEKGFWREALFRFERAASQRPEDPQIQNDLAVAYESVGETARALAAYKRALELAPGDSKIKRNYARFAEYYTSVQRAGSGPAPSAPASSAPAASSPAPSMPPPSTSPTPAPPEPTEPGHPPVPTPAPAPSPTPLTAPGPPK